MKICIISDTHGKHKHLPKLPDADMIIHCGDMSTVGREHEVREFMKWFGKLTQFRYKLIIAGNHDWFFERETNRNYIRSIIPSGVTYLQDSGIEIESLNFYGTPVTPPFYNWAFNREEEKLMLHWQAIPENVDVLITHGPPRGIMDYVARDKSHAGSPSLFTQVTERIKPQVNCFGHIHSGHGIEIINGIKFINASNLDEDYMMVYDPIVVEIEAK